jgi:hypothetical protein
MPLPSFLVVLAATICFIGPAAAVTIQTDSSMGIQAYSFLINAPELANNTAYELRVYMLATCDRKGGKQVHLRGFAGAFPIECT